MSLPAVDSFNQLGGLKVNYSQIVDPNTDVDGPQFSQMTFDVAAMTATATRCWVKFTGHATTPILVAHNSVWGNGAGVTPVVAHTGTGTYTVTFPTAVDDGLGQPTSSIGVNLRAPWLNLETLVFANSAKIVVTAPNVLTIQAFLTGAANDLAAINFNVFSL